LDIKDQLNPAPPQNVEVVGKAVFDQIQKPTDAIVRNLSVGDRVVIPSTIACGYCAYCRAGYHAQCDTANPNGAQASTAFFGGPEQKRSMRWVWMRLLLRVGQRLSRIKTFNRKFSALPLKLIRKAIIGILVMHRLKR
jgi:hypothetical protein